MTDDPTFPRLSNDRLADLESALEGSDSVELKLTVPDRDGRSAVRALEMDVLDAELSQVFFFDTPDLALNRSGVIVRARRTRGGDDTVVKLRPVVPQELSAELRDQKGFGVEVDAMPGSFVCSARLKVTKRRGRVKDMLSGGRTLGSLLSKQQRAFFTSISPAGTELGDLRTMGPILVLKLKFSPPGFAGRLVAELWTYPDGSRILELSTKCSSTDAFEVAARTRDYLAQRGIDLSAEQQTKTKTALEFFSREMASPPA